MSKQSNPSSKKSIPVAKLLYVGILLILIVICGVLFYKYQELNDKYTAATESSETRIRRVVDAVAKLYNIPNYDTEKPSIPGVDGVAIYTVLEEDLESLKQTNPFFADAAKDDVVIAYKDANLAILYRPSEKRIIKVGTYSQAFISRVQVTVIGPDGTQDTLKQNIEKLFPNAQVTTSSATVTVPTGIVYDATGSNEASAKQLATALGYSVGALPTGIKAPEGAVLVVVAPNTGAPTL